MEVDGNDQASDRRPADRQSRRRLTVAGLTALAVLGGGSYLISSRVAGRDGSIPSGDTGALAPAATPAISSSAAVSMLDKAAASPARPLSVTPSSAAPSPTAAASKATKAPARSSPAEVQKEIATAREKAAKEGHPLQRPLVASTAPIRDATSYSEENRSLQGGGTMRITSARYDLSGRGEMLWAADSGRPVGDAHCTQNFHFSQNGRATLRPTMLLCWRTSDERSVVVLSVGRKPSTLDSAGVIDEQWAKLG